MIEQILLWAIIGVTGLFVAVGLGLSGYALWIAFFASEDTVARLRRKMIQRKAAR